MRILRGDQGQRCWQDRGISSWQSGTGHLWLPGLSPIHSVSKYLLKAPMVDMAQMLGREKIKSLFHVFSCLVGEETHLATSVQFSRSVVSDSLRPHEPQHARPPCPSPTPGVHLNPCPLCWWCHPTVSSSVVPFFSCPQSFPASGSFPMSQLFTTGGQSIGVSASASDLPINIQDSLISFRMDWLDLLAVQGTLKSLLQNHSSKALILLRSAFFIVQLSHLYVTTGKTIALTRQTFVSKVMSLLFYMLSRLVITFLPRSKGLLISWLQSPSAVILEPRKIKLATVSTVSRSICHEVMGPDAMILVFWMLSFKPTFFTFLFHFHQYAV